MDTSKLANPEEASELLEERNKRIVRCLYKALSIRDTHTLHHLLAPDLEWWFHGPPSHSRHLLPLLTSDDYSNHVLFVPDLVLAFGSVVVAEGYDRTNLLWWVHAWTLTHPHGLITQVREYLNTSLTVTRLRTPPAPPQHNRDGASTSQTEIVSVDYCQSIWRSKLCDQSFPGLILAV